MTNLNQMIQIKTPQNERFENILHNIGYFYFEEEQPWVPVKQEHVVRPRCLLRALHD